MASNTTTRAFIFAIGLVASAAVIGSFVKDSLPFKRRDCCVLSFLHSIISPHTTLAVGLAAFVVSICSLGKYFLPYHCRGYGSPSPDLTVVISQPNLYETSQMYSAAEAYVGSKISLSTKRVRVTKQEADRSIAVTIDVGEEVVDIFEGVHVRWMLVREQELNNFELSFRKQHKDMVLGKYLKHVLDSGIAVKETAGTLKLHMMQYESWNPRDLVQPATFDTVAMDPDLKRTIVEDLDRIFKGDYCRRIGEVRKRGYLICGPPGTPKWSLIAAMANYLKFDIYNLSFTQLSDKSSLRTVLLATTNRSLLAVDGDEEGDLTLADVFNVMDGIWSGYGDERIVVLTTNDQRRLDRALLRPGRMDVHVNMSYCKPHLFRSLVKNYYGVENHPSFPEIERMLEEEVDVTPAEVRGKLLYSDDVDVALAMLVAYLEEKKEGKTELTTPDGPLKVHMLQYESWNPIDLVDPATFETIAMEPDLKCTVVDDLDRIFKSDYCTRIGEARKRGYLICGPPGTAKWSLVAAMANYLKFDMYNLSFTQLPDKSSLRTVLLATTNRSILVVDGDEEGDLTLADVFNVMDGIWSGYGDERIVVLTANDQKRLDRVLLRPGRMDVHVNMSYCKPQVFRWLVKNYYSVEKHPSFPEIERMLGEEVNVTPAEVRGKLLGSVDVDVALAMLMEYLEEKKKEIRTLEREEEDDRECNIEKNNDGEAKKEEIEQ